MRGSSPASGDLPAGPVLVTGAGGFIGGHLCRRLAALGVPVRGLVRRPEGVAFLEAAGARAVIGDLTRPDTLPHALRGCATVVHCAAWMGQPPSWEAARAINVLGTRALAEAAAREGVGRVVHLSSIAVYGPTTAGRITEDSPLWPLGPYRATKIGAEREVCAARRLGLRVVILRPGQVFGPGELRLAGRVLAWLRKGWPLVVDGGTGVCHPVYVDNLLDAVLAAAAPRAPEGIYNIADGDVPWRQFLGVYAAAAGRPLRSVPSWVARAVALAAEAAAALTGRLPSVRRAEVGYLVRRTHFSTARARQLLGWTPRTRLEQAMEQTVAWLRQAGHLPDHGSAPRTPGRRPEADRAGG